MPELWRGTAGEKAPTICHAAEISQPFQFQAFPIAGLRYIRWRGNWLRDADRLPGTDIILRLRFDPNGKNTTIMAGNTQAIAV